MPTPWPQPRPSSRKTVPAGAAAGSARAARMTANPTRIADRERSRGRRGPLHLGPYTRPVRNLLLELSAAVSFEPLFFTALTPRLPHFADELSLGKTGAGVLAAAYPAGAFL